MVTTYPTAEIFKPLVDCVFLVKVDSHSQVPARLIEVADLPPATTRDDLPLRKDPFSLVFKVEGGIELRQRTYEVEHERAGKVELFLVPIGFDEYESIFN